MSFVGQGLLLAASILYNDAEIGLRVQGRLDDADYCRQAADALRIAAFDKRKPLTCEVPNHSDLLGLQAGKFST